MISLDGTIVANIAPTIVNKFHSVPLLPWLSVGYVVDFSSKLAMSRSHVIVLWLVVSSLYSLSERYTKDMTRNGSTSSLL